MENLLTKKYIHIILMGFLSALIISSYKFIGGNSMSFFNGTTELLKNIMNSSIVIILIGTIYMANIGLGYFYTKNKNLSFGLKEMIIIILVTFLFVRIILLILPTIWIAYKYQISSWDIGMRGIINIFSFNSDQLLIVSFIIAGFFGLKLGLKTASETNKALIQNRMQIKYFILIISNIIGLCSLLTFGFLAFSIVAMSMGMLNNKEGQILLTLVSISLLSMILSLYAWQYYDRKTTTISHRGFIFSLLPIIGVFICLIILLFIFSSF